MSHRHWFIKPWTASCSDIWFVLAMLRQERLAEGNPQLLTLVHGVDRKGRPVIREYTGNSRHPVYHEYQDVIEKQYQKGVRLSPSSRRIHSLYSLNVNDRCFDCCSQRARTSTAATHASTRWSPSLAGSSGARAPIIPDMRGMRAVISRLRCSLAIHAGLVGKSNDLTYLPVIPVRSRKQPNCPKKTFAAKIQAPPIKPDLKEDSAGKACYSNGRRSIAASLSYNTDCCQGCKGRTCSKAKKKNRRVKGKRSRWDKNYLTSVQWPCYRMLHARKKSISSSHPVLGASNCYVTDF